jgi:chondroitin 4-sulfotransferase 11
VGPAGVELLLFRGGGADDDDKEWFERHLARYGDFGGFVRGWLINDSIWSSPYTFQPQCHYICDAESRVRVDFVGRMETLKADFHYVCERLGIAVELQRVNTSNHRHYSEYYSKELREYVATIYAKDIAIFGYQFEAPSAAS